MTWRPVAVAARAPAQPLVINLVEQVVDVQPQLGPVAEAIAGMQADDGVAALADALVVRRADGVLGRQRSPCWPALQRARQLDAGGGLELVARLVGIEDAADTRRASTVKSGARPADMK